MSTKGKGKDHPQQWSAGWWEYHALLDQTQRPVAWASTSTIFSAHPTQALVTARHSSKQFVLQSPAPILSSPGSYEPPTVISVSPSGEWLFAYFPSSEMDGVACLWQRGAPLDVWGVKEWWSCGAGIVTASWLGGPREWTVDDTGSPSRLPPRGPPTPVSNLSLILVTESRWVTVCYLRQYSSQLRMITCPLFEPTSAGEGRPNPIEQGPNRHASIRICTRAAIGLAYNDHSMNSMNLTLPLTLEMPSSEPDLAIEWETWGEESYIELSEVRLDFEGMVVSAVPLPALHSFELGLTNLTFISTPPHPQGVLESSPDILYLAASYLDFGDYTSTPKSELVLHALSRVPESAYETPPWVYFVCRHVATRSFSESVLAYIVSNPSGQASSTFGLYAGIINSSGPLPRGNDRAKEVAIGTTRVLKLPDLTDHERWEPGHIMSPVDSAGRDLPLNAVLSFNNSMLLCTTLSSVGVSRITMQTMPKLGRSTPSKGLSDFVSPLRSAMNISADLLSIPPVSVRLAISLLSGTSTSDLSHLLALPSMSLDEVTENLFHALILAENGQDKGTLTWRALGLVLETYRSIQSFLLFLLLISSRVRALRFGSEMERETLEARAQTALDMCSLASCNAAFEDCKDGDGFDLDAVWLLFGLSAWVIGFVEKLLKQCVLSSDLTGSSPGDPEDDLFSSEASSAVFQIPPPSILLHLAHPYALRSLHTALTNVTRFKDKIGSLSASEENSQIAKNIIVDLIDCSGVDLIALEVLLSELLVEAKKFGVEETRRSLALCEPTSEMGRRLRNAIQKVASGSLVNKPRLFIKPFELMDGVPQIFDTRKDKTKDVITKGALSGRIQGVVCVRCGGKSEVGGGMNATPHVSGNWRAWEKLWIRHCICGGAWVLAPRVAA
ncbi:hypothetical protein DFH06DRAFT_970910 [Mycena polygramma]|nr:hypothetical protein DFH06DRAFT_970910 [Mycena polygramma]